MPSEPIIIYSDRSLVVCIKPVGAECEKELPSALEALLPGKRVYCVHRLDTAVGGLMVFAIGQSAAAALSKAIAENALKKEYLAVIPGTPAESSGIMHDYLYKDVKKGKSFPVKSLRKGVKEAELSYTVLETAGEKALVHVTLHTGRFHQIRAQFAARKLPLLGDGKYGSREKGCGIALFSCGISFPHPETGEMKSFCALPERAFPWDAFGYINDKRQEGL